MARPTADTDQITFRLPRATLAEADAIAAELLSRPGMQASRTDALRAAIEEGFKVMRARHSRERAVAALDTVYAEHQPIIARPELLELGVSPKLRAALSELTGMAEARKDSAASEALALYRLVISKGADYATSRAGRQQIPRNFDALMSATRSWIEE